MKKNKKFKPHRSPKGKHKRTAPVKKASNKNSFTGQDMSNISWFLQKRYPNTNIYEQEGRITLDCPQIMRMGDKVVGNQVLEFLDCIRYICSRNIPLRINIVTLQDISPMCALMLASEFHTWQLLKDMKLRLLDADKWNPQVRRRFAELGLFDLVIVSNGYHQLPTDGAEKFAKLRSEQVVKMSEALGNIEREVAKIALTMRQNFKMYGGIEEAVTNVTQWAYKGVSTLPKKLKNRWWFCASYNVEKKRTTIMVYDHGMGIPKTLPRSGRLEDIRNFIQNFDINTWQDADIIEAAMQTPRSASGKNYRGKGLQWMRDLLPQFKEGTLLILSGKGEYRIDHMGVAQKRNFDTALGGTLIAWEVYGSDDDDNQND